MGEYVKRNYKIHRVRKLGKGGKEKVERKLTLADVPMLDRSCKN